MRLPVISGVIRRRLLVNFAGDAGVVQRLLPAPLRPKLSATGEAVVGICLIRLEQIRPAHVPAALGISSENAAHRFAVEWTEPDGTEREGVYIPRRDTDSVLNHLAGGRLFPGEHHRARFDVRDEGGVISLRMTSIDGSVAVEVEGRESDRLGAQSVFGSLETASEYFRKGSLGYSERKDGDLLDGITLHTDHWAVTPLEISSVRSTYFSDPERFPPGTLRFDCALLMRDVPHSWRSEPDLRVREAAHSEHGAGL